MVSLFEDEVGEVEMLEVGAQYRVSVDSDLRGPSMGSILVEVLRQDDRTVTYKILRANYVKVGSVFTVTRSGPGFRRVFVRV